MSGGGNGLAGAGSALATPAAGASGTGVTGAALGTV
jgi:hypothetical protein